MARSVCYNGPLVVFSLLEGPMQETRVFVTHDEEFNPASRIGDQVKRFIRSLPLDTHNKRYVVRVSVEEVLDPQYQGDDDEEC